MSGTPWWLALAIAAVAALIAWRQYSVAQDKLRLDLFEKRFRVFDAARRVLADFIAGPEPKSTRLLTFAWETADAQFLFGPEVVGYLDEVIKRLSRLHAANVLIANRAETMYGDQQARQRAIEEREAILGWIVDQRDVLVAVMRPYLHFGDVRARR